MSTAVQLDSAPSISTRSISTSASANPEPFRSASISPRRKAPDTCCFDIAHDLPPSSGYLTYFLTSVTSSAGEPVPECTISEVFPPQHPSSDQCSEHDGTC